jgi:hypothetical protein
VQEQLRQALVQWMQALVRTIREEDDDEQDHRGSSGPAGLYVNPSVHA